MFRGLLWWEWCLLVYGANPDKRQSSHRIKAGATRGGCSIMGWTLVTLWSQPFLGTLPWSGKARGAVASDPTCQTFLCTVFHLATILYVGRVRIRFASIWLQMRYTLCTWLPSTVTDAGADRLPGPAPGGMCWSTVT